MASNEDRIRQRAYEIWEREGRPHGEDLKHWLRAFQEIAASGEANRQPAKKSHPKKATTAGTPAKPKSTAKAKSAGKTKSDAQSVSATPPPAKPARASGGVTKH